MTDPQPHGISTPEEREKQEVFLRSVVGAIEGIFNFAHEADVRVDEIMLERGSVGPSDSAQYEQQVVDMVNQAIQSLHGMDGAPHEWVQNAEEMLKEFFDIRRVNLLNHVNMYMDPRRHAEYCIDKLSHIDNETTRRIVYLTLLAQDPAIFLNDPDKRIQPGIDRLLSRIDPSRLAGSGDPFSMTPEVVIEALLSDPLILEKTNIE